MDGSGGEKLMKRRTPSVKGEGPQMHQWERCMLFISSADQTGARSSTIHVDVLIPVKATPCWIR